LTWDRTPDFGANLVYQSSNDLPEPSIVICDECQDQPAAVFLTKIVGGVSQKRNLCTTCYERDQSPQERAIQDTLEQGCAYCGDQAVGAGYHATHGPIATCSECAKASYDYMLEALGFDPAEIASGEHLDPLPKLKAMSLEEKAEFLRKVGGVEEYMRRRKQR